MEWVKIILYILELILLGIEKSEAIEKASFLFDVDIHDLWDHF